MFRLPSGSEAHNSIDLLLTRVSEHGKRRTTGRNRADLTARRHLSTANACARIHRRVLPPTARSRTDFRRSVPVPLPLFEALSARVQQNTASVFDTAAN